MIGWESSVRVQTCVSYVVWQRLFYFFFLCFLFASNPSSHVASLLLHFLAIPIFFSSSSSTYFLHSGLSSFSFFFYSCVSPSPLLFFSLRISYLHLFPLSLPSLHLSFYIFICSISPFLPFPSLHPPLGRLRHPLCFTGSLL